MLKKVIQKHTNSDQCFACGERNSAGLGMEFYDLDDGSIVGLVTLKDNHVSYPTVVHGGITATMLDEAMGRCSFQIEPDTWCVTLEMTVRYKKSVPPETPLRVPARVVENREHVFICEGEILLPDDTVAAYARGVYYKSVTTGAADAGLNEMHLNLHGNEPTEIELPKPFVRPQ